jgi:hypothetical protein
MSNAQKQSCRDKRLYTPIAGRMQDAVLEGGGGCPKHKSWPQIPFPNPGMVGGIYGEKNEKIRVLTCSLPSLFHVHLSIELWKRFMEKE